MFVKYLMFLSNTNFMLVVIVVLSTALFHAYIFQLSTREIIIYVYKYYMMHAL